MTAKTWQPTQEEMKSRIARFKDLVSTKTRHAEGKGIPLEVLEMITAKSTFNVMSPGNLGGQLSPNPPVIGGDAGVFRLGFVTCPPGNGPGLHVHWNTHETFIAMTGKWEIRWGDKGEERPVIEPFDLIAVPPGVTRQFINISGQDAHLMVIIKGQPGEFGRCRTRTGNRRVDREKIRARDARQAKGPRLAVHVGRERTSAEARLA